MSADEMYELFLTLYDKWGSNAAPPYDKFQISLFLTQSQNEMIKRRLTDAGNKYGHTFEETEKRASEFQALIKNAELDVSSNQQGTFPGGVFYDLPKDFWLGISEYANIEFDDTNVCFKDNTKQFVRVSPKRHDEVMANVDNPYEQPYTEEVWRLKFSDYDVEVVYGVVVDNDTVTLDTKLSGVTIVDHEGNANPGMDVNGDITLMGPGKWAWILLSNGEKIIATLNTFKYEGGADIAIIGGEPSFVSEVMDTHRRHELIVDDSYVVSSYKMRYLRKPNPIILEDLPLSSVPEGESIYGFSNKRDCELDEMFHEEIVKDAVRKAVATNDEAQSYQIQSRESELSE